MARTPVYPNSSGGHTFLMRVLVEHADALTRIDGNSTTYSDSTTTLYASVSGSDSTGNGSGTAPYRTLQKLVEKVSLILAQGKKFVLDVTDLGDEILPEGFNFPPWVGTADSTITIRADMKEVALAAGAQTFTPTAIARTNVSGAYTVTDTTQAWPNIKALGDGYCKYAQWSDGEGGFLYGKIYDNDGTHLYITCDDPPFGNISIVEPSARLICTNANLSCTAHVDFQGIAFVPAEASALPVWYARSLGVWKTSASFDHCTLDHVYLAASPYRYYLTGCDLIGTSITGSAYISHCRVADFGGVLFESPIQIVIKHGTVFENFDTIRPYNLGEDNFHFGGNLQIIGAWLKGATGTGLRWDGGKVEIKDLKVDDSGADALFFDGPMRVSLANVAGTGNTGVGVKLDNGAVVECKQKEGSGTSIEFIEDLENGSYTALTSTGAGFTGGGWITITGATTPANNGTFAIYGPDDEDSDILYIANDAGVTEAFAGDWIIDPITIGGASDQKAGSQSAAAWPAVPYDVLDVNYDPTGGAPTRATGTGSRLFNK